MTGNGRPIGRPISKEKALEVTRSLNAHWLSVAIQILSWDLWENYIWRKCRNQEAEDDWLKGLPSVLSCNSTAGDINLVKFGGREATSKTRLLSGSLYYPLK